MGCMFMQNRFKKSSRALLRFVLFAAILAYAGGPLYSFDKFEENSGVTLSGSSGLLTIPTPDFATRTRGLSFKQSETGSSIIYNGSVVNLNKDETSLTARAKIDPEVEISLVYLSYDRVSIPQLTGSVNHYGIGAKYSPADDARDICFGFNFVPMDSYESVLADIEQIESLRNVYVTAGEALTQNLNGYINLLSAFTGKQKIEFSDGTRRDVKRNDILTGSLGLSYRFRKFVSLFGEFKVGHYRDMISDDSVRYRIHGGIRLSTSNVQFECAGFNLTDNDPALSLGCSICF